MERLVGWERERERGGSHGSAAAECGHIGHGGLFPSEFRGAGWCARNHGLCAGGLRIGYWCCVRCGALAFGVFLHFEMLRSVSKRCASWAALRFFFFLVIGTIADHFWRTGMMSDRARPSLLDVDIGKNLLPQSWQRTIFYWKIHII